MHARVATVEQLSLLLELGRAFSALMDPETLLPAIMDQTKEVLQAESCALLLLDEARQEWFFPAVSDVSPEREERFQGLRFPVDQGIAGWVLRHGQATLVPDVSCDQRFNAAVDRETGAHTRDLLYAPLRTRRGVIGVIGLRNKRDGTFTEDDLAFLDALAGPIAIALENASLYQQVRQSEVRLQEEVATLHRELVHRQRFTEIIGSGAAMTQVFALMESAIASSLTVLLEGETGTGKELIARATHHNGPRKGRPLVVVSCGALPDTLLESELFGHKKGAFTGATADKAGLFEVAHGSTLFLDEIEATSPAMQVNLLRVLQEGELRRLGETQIRRVDVRVIAATNRDLTHEVQRQRFREDLYYRLCVFPIRVPPLRERREDIPLLVAHFLRRSIATLGKPIPGLTPDALEVLGQYPWPGNVRELENELTRAVALAPEGTLLTPAYFSERLTAYRALRIPLPTQAGSLKQARLTFERAYIAVVLRQHQGNATQTAQVLGLSRQALQQKIKAYGLRDEDEPPAPVDGQ